MRALLAYIARRVVEPLRCNGSFFIFIYALFVVACLAQPEETIADYPFAELFADVFALSFLLSFVPQPLRRVAQGVVALLCVTVCAVDVYTGVRLGSGLTPTMLQLAMETNADEASEFWQSYVCNRQTLQALWPFLLWAAVYVAYACRGRKRLSALVRRQMADSVCHTAFRVVYALVAWGLFACAVLWSWEDRRHEAELLSQTTTTGMERYYNKGYGRKLYTPLHRLWFSIYANRLAAEQLVHLHHAVEHTVVDTCSHAVPTLVVIIGESYNRHHASLYGYGLPTTPRQSARAQSGELFPFTDVVTCWNLTSNVFKYTFSLFSYGTKGSWADRTLYPAVFRRAGYRVTFLTNQFVREPDDDAFDFSGGYFLNDPWMSNRLFDVRNRYKYPYDEGLLLEYDSLQGLQPATDNLVIFHLIGQHVGYENRCPEDRKRFTQADYHRPDLTDNQLQKVVDYDNATLYNDSVVDAILRRFENEDALVVYVPDHGEEVFDGLKVFGRLHSSALTPKLVRNEFEIPFWIWCSPRYRKNRPQMVRRIRRAVDRPFMTDDLPHTLLHLAGIRCPGYDERRALVSPQFDTSRRRLLKGYKDYDELMNKTKE
ncbi:MAG: lipid A phosphoethanolamine transferase [Clostridium sp.]|nr:lipid A phosphoethanolamine transferase [Clostridium sp.]